ncbi:hypothetical protein, unlikely [Trypanosoma brucei gambiense DAL972]|nr:hypothetical protein, unlikely [Trypanosoma brucei gambiense DAL972]CBH15013.1 hypothetical protein, unlikely [Trypanosoma brucei gambiense DAL972]|eukprot:XP_011777279.1 hypothetical protein, unlikely [Trypanosoma brucei gambiense DAL972]
MHSPFAALSASNCRRCFCVVRGKERGLARRWGGERGNNERSTITCKKEKKTIASGRVSVCGREKGKAKQRKLFSPVR